MKRAVILIALCAALPAAYAEDKGNYEAKKREFEAKKMEHFGKMKSVKLEGLQGRISVMQAAASCIQSAQSPDAMRSCEERERSGMEQLNQHMKARWESLKPQ